MVGSTTHYGLTKPLGTEYYNVSVPNGNMDKIDTALHALGSGLAIIATGDTHAAASSGDFIYIHSHGTLAEGLYKATTSIAQNATLSGSNVTAVTGGGLNTKVDKVSGKGLSANDYTTTEKTKLAGIESGAQVNPGAATTSAAGLMSAADKTKLNGIANNYSLPTAANGTKGGIQIGYTQSGKNYPVQLSSEKAYVNVPWSDTTYSNATTSTAGLMSAVDKYKLNNISAGANKIVWDVAEISTGSVSAGALKDVEKVLTLPSSRTLIGVCGVYPTYGNFEIRGFSVSTANNQKSIIIKVKNSSNASASDTLYVSYLMTEV